MEEHFQRAIREKREEHPHEWVVTIRPEEGEYPPPHYEMANQTYDDQHDTQETRVTMPPHNISLLDNARIKLY
jgi:hypothetical protein